MNDWGGNLDKITSEAEFTIYPRKDKGYVSVILILRCGFWSA
jgi:hypothetical protein